MIILLGFPKSGTTSFQSLFTELGYNSVHWTKENDYIGMLIKHNKKLQRPLLYGFKNIDCITQLDVCVSHEESYWPQLVDYEQIYYENKNAIFILNKRDPYKLLSSFKRWGNLDERLYNFSPEIIQDKTDEGFIKFVKEHYNKVEFFFKDKSANFVSFDIDNDELCKIGNCVNLNNKTKLPHFNKNKVG